MSDQEKKSSNRFVTVGKNTLAFLGVASLFIPAGAAARGAWIAARVGAVALRVGLGAVGVATVYQGIKAKLNRPQQASSKAQEGPSAHND